eukprot:TRINITY_DN24992_c0_g1_i1.p1 TRINITY_DN24992_c0_g1~~TRINITY_DN24992_c0_g1_i1.p1  ORF type:complete len:596 (-),score=101.11 TRINITY_DN24992_c0_g1_i1:11-1798(-)
MALDAKTRKAQRVLATGVRFTGSVEEDVLRSGSKKMSPIAELRVQIDEALSRCRSEVDSHLDNLASHYKVSALQAQRPTTPQYSPPELSLSSAKNMVRASSVDTCIDLGTQELHPFSLPDASPDSASDTSQDRHETQESHVFMRHGAGSLAPNALERAQELEDSASEDWVSMMKTRTVESNVFFKCVDDLKQEMRRSIETDRMPELSELLHDEGILRAIVTHPYFEYLSLTVIIMHVIWMGFDADMNKAATILDADIEFVIVENLFCIYFLAELLIRIFAFKQKCRCYKDGWFVLDACLVAFTLFETWILPLVLLVTGVALGSPKTPARLTRYFRIARLTRLARMAHILYAVPEFLIFVKAIGVSMKTVLYALALFVTTVYIFSIAFTQMTDGYNQPEGTAAYDHFRSVPIAMNTLLLQGALPDQADLIDVLQSESPAYYALMLVFLFFASLTLMNMLIGILCEVISAVSQVEKETMLIKKVKSQLLDLMRAADVTFHEDNSLTRMSYERLLLHPRAVSVFAHLGVDIFSMVDFSDVIFAKADQISFADFMAAILELRGSNYATVKDIIELRKLVSKSERSFFLLACLQINAPRG